MEEIIYVIQVASGVTDGEYPEPEPTIEVSGTIQKNTTWNSETVKVTGQLTIPDSVTLTINPGTYVEFQGLHRINVKGTLLAQGTPGNPITFTAKDPNHGWNGIRFDSIQKANDTSKLVHCILEHATSVITPFDQNDNGGAVFVRNYSNLVISNCTISDNNSSGKGGGIYCYNSNPTLTDNIITNNTASYAGGIYLDHSTPVFTGNAITNNIATNYGGGIQIDHSYAVLKNNTVSNNTASYAGGIYIYDSTVVLANNIISNNTASQTCGGIHFSSSFPTLANNLIANNKASSDAGGILFDSTSGTLTNNTISNNISSGNGGGIYCNWNSDPKFTNTILWGNTGNTGTQVYLKFGNSDPYFYYCDIQDGTAGFTGDGAAGNYDESLYMHNIDADPLFTNPPGSDWSLQGGSPCINSGDQGTAIGEADLAGNPRIKGGAVDMGAYEYQE